MKNNKACGEFRRMPAALHRLLILCILSCSAFSPVTAQYYNSMIYGFTNTNTTPTQYDVKGFSTEMVPGGSHNLESVMAGTMYDTGSNWGIPAFIHCDGGAVGVDWPKIMPNGPGNFFYTYDDPNFFDERVADIVSDGAGLYYIIISAREDNANVTGAQDKIKVIAVDVNGAPQAVFNQPGGPYSSIVITDGGTGSTRGNLGTYCLYPTHGIFKAGVYSGSGTQDLLYICGYVNQANTTRDNSGYIAVSSPPPAWGPGESSPKAAFVLTIDVSNAASNMAPGAVRNYRNYDYQPTFAGTPNCIYDFDIATRMTPMSANYNTNINPNPSTSGEYIHLTGSVTSATGTGNGSGGPSGAYNIRSATMNMVIDAWDLTNRAEGHFITNQTNADGIGPSEYGIGFKENTYQVSSLWYSDNYVVSNIYGGLASSSYNQWLYYSGPNGYLRLFNFRPDSIAITHTLGNMQSTYYGPTGPGTIGAQQQRLFVNEDWAVQVLESSYSTASSSPSGTTMLIAGMDHENIDVNNTTPASEQNVQPFLWDLDIDFSAPNTVAPGQVIIPFTGANYLRVFWNQAGTANPTTGRHDYLGLGNELSDILWNPTFAARYNTSNDIVLNAPRYYTTGGASGSTIDALGLKPIFAFGGNTISTSYTPTCNNYVSPADNSHFIQPYDDEVTSLFNVIDVSRLSDISTTYITDTPPTSGQTVTNLGDCQGNTTGGGGSVRKPAGITQIRKEQTRIYPNPAKSEINVVVSKNIADEANVKVILVNMHGQLLSTLYNGTAKNASTKYTLPEVASGLYIVQVYSDGIMVHHEKLTIQQ